MLEHIMSNLDKLFSLNFTILAFIVTALTILMSIDSRMIQKFKDAGYFDDIIKCYEKAILWQFISGILILIIWLVQYKEYRDIQAGFSLIVFVVSLYYSYKAYAYLMFFVKKKPCS